MATTLGQLVRLDPRHAWRDEAVDFTPWLADNLPALGAVLGMDLEFVSRENAVGPFSADIVARDINRDRLVLIENQLEATDHRHLGQLLTYAAGLDAATSVWISREMREEHRQALDWLNRRSDDEAEFFGVVVELLQIDDSRPALNFCLVAFPNSWNRTRRAAARGPSAALSSRQTAYQDFFQHLMDELRERHRFTNARRAQPKNWCPFRSDTPGFVYEAAFATDNRLRAGLYIDSGLGELNQAIFEHLQAERTTIEVELGESLSWELLETKRACRLALYRPDSSIVAPEEGQQRMLEGLVAQLLQLKQVLGPRLRGAVATAEERVGRAEQDEPSLRATSADQLAAE